MFPIRDMKKRGVFFSTDAVIALMIILVALVAFYPIVSENKINSRVNYDVLNTLSSLKINQMNNPYVIGLVSSGAINNTNNSVLEQIGEFYVTDEDTAKDFASNVMSGLDFGNENFGLWYESTLIYSQNSTPFESAKDVETARRIISGLKEGQGVTGFSARASLSSRLREDYFYFGGYVGQGNLSVLVNYAGTVESAEMEAVISDDFELYVNGNSTGSYSASPSEFEPSVYSIPADNFVSGDNTIEIKGDNLHISGGFIKVIYESDVQYEETDKYYFPGVTGLINLYDGFYIPNELENLKVYLHLNSSQLPTFLSIGNVTVFEKVTDGEESITLNDSQLSSSLSYTALSNKTIPLRLGLENVSYEGILENIDVFSVTDLSGSMNDNCIPYGCDSSCACSGSCGICDAKTGNGILIDIILNNSGNEIGLAGYETLAKDSDYYALSSDSESLNNVVLNNWDASGNTCICCGINKAVGGFDLGVVSSRVFKGTDDAEERLSNGAVTTISSDLELIKDGSKLQEVGMRFQDINIPHGSTISSAYIEFDTSQTSSETTDLTFSAEATDNAHTFSTSRYDISSRTETSAEVTWSSVSAWNTVGEKHQTPDLSSVVQEIVDRPGWNFGNSMVILVEGSGSRVAESYNGDSDNAPLLVISYEVERESYKSMVVMSDGQANGGCDEQGVTGDLNGNGYADDSGDDAIQASCDAFNDYGVVTYAVGFGSSVDEDTLQEIAACGNGTYFYANVDELAEVYEQVASIIITNYNEQSLESDGDLFSNLYGGSYIEFGYNKINSSYGFVIKGEKIFDDANSGSFYVPPGATVLEASVASYSGAKWTSSVLLNGVKVYNLADYGSDFTSLGDPYIVHLPVSLITNGTNYVNLTTGVSKTNSSSGSQYNKILYTLERNASVFSEPLASASGCQWEVQFEDDSVLNVSVPSSYDGNDKCVYNATRHSILDSIYNSNDAFQVAVFYLLEDIDLDSNGKIDIVFNEQQLQISLSEIEGVPVIWAIEVQARVWK